MNKAKLKSVLSNLRNPTVLFSILSQIVAILILIGVDIDEDTAITVIGMVISVLASAGIVSKVDMSKKDLVVEDLYCPVDGRVTQHIKINGRMVCVGCGAVYKPPAEDETAEEKINTPPKTSSNN